MIVKIFHKYPKKRKRKRRKRARKVYEEGSKPLKKKGSFILLLFHFMFKNKKYHTYSIVKIDLLFVYLNEKCHTN